MGGVTGLASPGAGLAGGGCAADPAPPARDAAPALRAADGRTIEVETLPGPCTDGINGLTHEFGLRVRVDGAPPLAGCGRALY